MAILFDLDGTLLDTAPDFHNSINLLLKKENRPSVSYELIRPVVSFGSSRMVTTAFDLDIENNAADKAYHQLLLPQFLEIYRETNFRLTKAFPGIDDMLDEIEQLNLPWGIVTNKPKAFTDPLLKVAGYFNRTNCVVSGDTTAYSKPDPTPLNYACDLLNVTAKNCVYIGDAATDVQAGKAAGMATIIAAFGYIPDDVHVNSWQADHIAHSPNEILTWIKQWSKQAK